MSEIPSISGGGRVRTKKLKGEEAESTERKSFMNVDEETPGDKIRKKHGSRGDINLPEEGSKERPYEHGRIWWGPAKWKKTLNPKEDINLPDESKGLAGIHKGGGRITRRK